MFYDNGDNSIIALSGRGTLSAVTFLLIAFLVLSEIGYHMDSELNFDYKVIPHESA